MVFQELMLFFLVDPTDIYASERELGSKDALDFRHHNYKEMRKVRVIKSVRPQMHDE